MDSGLTPTNLKAKIFNYAGTNIFDYASSPALLETTYGNFLPKIGTNPAITNVATYDATLPPSGGPADRLLSGAGAYLSNNGYFFTVAGGTRTKESTFTYNFGSFGSNYPLTELKNIKIYVPGNNDNLKLNSIKPVTTTLGLGLSFATKLAPDYNMFWDNMNISERLVDDNGNAYYNLTPKTRLFNLGILGKPEVLLSSFVPEFRLIDTTIDLPFETNKIHLSESDNLEITYNEVTSTNTPIEKTYSNKGAVIRTLMRDEAQLFYAYNGARYKDLEIQSNLNVIMGSYHYGERFNSFTYKYSLDPKTPDIELLPSYRDKYLQVYDFPFAIQPSSMQITKSGYIGVGHHLQKQYIQAISVTYTLTDGTVKTATDAEIAAINNYQSYKTGTIPRVNFVGITESNPVKKVEILWDDFGDYDYYGYPFGDYGYNSFNINRATGKVASVTGGNQNDPYYGTAINFDYYVSKYKDPSLTELHLNYDMVQVQLHGSTESPSTLTDEYNPDFLWFRLVPEIDPELYGTKESNIYRAFYPGLLDNTSLYTMGSIGFDVGKRGEKKDILVNPVIDLETKLQLIPTDPTYKKSQVYIDTVWTNYMTGMTEVQAISFLSGGFIGTPGLSNWTFKYSTNQRTDVEYQVGTLTTDTFIQLPLQAGEAFTKLELYYTGDYNAAHPSDGGKNGLDSDSDIYLELMKDILLKAYNVNPITNEPIYITDYETSAVVLTGVAKWDNFDPRTGQIKNMLSGSAGYHGVTWDRNHPHAFLYTTQDYLITERRPVTIDTKTFPQTTLNDNYISIYQGETATQTLDFSHYIKVGTTYSNNPNYSSPGKPSDSWIKSSYEENVSVAGTGNDVTKGSYPWEVAEKAYIELADNEMVFEPANSTFYGVPLNDPNVTYEYVTLNGRKFIKVGFVEGYDRGKIQPTSNPNIYSTMADGRIVTHNNDVIYENVNLSGPIQISFTAVPGSRTGDHYPIGDMYLDFSDAVDKYNAHELSSLVDGSIDGITNYTIKDAVVDSLGLSSTTTTEPKLLKYDFRQTSDTPYKINVLRASDVGSDITPGKNDGEYDFVNKDISFKTHEANDLNQLVSMTSSISAPTFGMTTYVKLPKEGQVTKYNDENSVLQTKVSDYTINIDAVPEIYQSVGLKDDVVIKYFYTYDANYDPPINVKADKTDIADNAVYTEIPPATPEEFKKVTGIKIYVSELPAESAITFKLDLSTPTKNTLNDIYAYSSGTFSYFGDVGMTQIDVGRLTLNTWEYQTYDLVKGNIFWDTYNENGLQGLTEADGSLEELPIENIKVKLYDKNDVLIDETLTDSNGNYLLRSYILDEGQYVVIETPDGSKLTKQSDVDFQESLIDSDFDRESNKLVLPQATPLGFKNVSAGIVKLPEIQAPDIEIILGRETEKEYKATLIDYLGMDITDDLDAYKLEYNLSNDESIATVLEKTVTNNDQTTTITGVKYGTTTATVKVKNTLGNYVEKTFNIIVKDQRYKVEHYVRQVGNGNNVGEFKHLVEDDSIVSSISIGEKPTDGVTPNTYTGFIYDNTKYLDSATAETSTQLVVKEDGSLVVRLYYEKEMIDISGTKTWSNMEVYHDRELPQAIINIYRSVNGVEETTPIISKTVSDKLGNVYQASVFKYDNDLNEYSYRFVEEELPYFISTQNDKDFENKYDPIPTTLNLPVINKALSGVNDPHEETFKFKLEPIGDAPAPLVNEFEITGEGSVETSSVEFKFGGSKAAPIFYQYKITEIDLPNSYINEEEIIVTVEVIDSDGNVKARVAKIENSGTTTNSVIFTNEYKPDPITYELSIDKIIEGNETVKDETFTFNIVDKEGKITTASISGEGNVVSTLEFKEAGEYTFTITEVKGSHIAYTYDESKFVLTVIVTDTDGVLSLISEITKEIPIEVTDPEGEPGIVEDIPVEYEVVESVDFTNIYTPKPVRIDPPVEKEIIGNPNNKQTFTFIMKADDPTYPMPEGSVEGEKEMSIDGAGSVEFGWIEYTETGTYTYSISEKQEVVTGYTYDEEVYTVTVIVSDDGNGYLKAERIIENSSKVVKDVALFINEYKAPNTPIINKPEEKPVIYQVPNTSSNNDIMTWFIMIFISISGLLVIRKKRFF